MKPLSTIPPTADVAASAFQSIMRMSTGFWLSRSIHVVAELGIADAVDQKTGTTVSGLAIATKTNEQALARILRFLSSVDVFALECGDSGVLYVEHTPASLLLRSDSPQSLRPFARMIGSPISWASFGKLEHSLRTGAPAVPEVAGDGCMGIFDWFTAHPEEARVFDDAMAAKSHGQIAGVLGAYDFAPFACIADVGGGSGHLITAILDKTPLSRGILVDLPHVVARAEQRERLTAKAADFFVDALPAADLYILMEVIHDWNDRDATRILQAVRRAAPPSAKVLVVEHMVQDRAGEDWAKALDINMLTLTGGLERTRVEYDRMLASTGFRLDRVLRTESSPIFVMEASAA